MADFLSKKYRASWMRIQPQLKIAKYIMISFVVFKPFVAQWLLHGTRAKNSLIAQTRIYTVYDLF